MKKDFFESWSPEMAYILGYFLADGDISINPQGSHYINFTSTDFHLLRVFKEILGSKHKISKRIDNNPCHRPRYRLQLGSKDMFNRFRCLGFGQRKKKFVSITKVPKVFIRDFVRGYFDGDGNISFGLYKRKTRKRPMFVMLARFISCSKTLLESLHSILCSCAGINGGFVCKHGSAFCLTFSIKDACRLYEFMYSDPANNLCITRKKKKFERAIKMRDRRPVV